MEFNRFIYFIEFPKAANQMVSILALQTPSFEDRSALSTKRMTLTKLSLSKRVTDIS